MRRNQKKKSVFVAMSGGVDSSVAAALLKQKGYHVVGVTMCFDILSAGKKPLCYGAEAIEDARHVAQTLDIPHHVLNFGTEIEQEVVSDFLEEYLQGRTPNPCVRCNQHIKFGSLLKKVKHLGADYLATGHYARIQRNLFSKKYELKKSIQGAKDQSYFLYQIRSEDLSSILFPIGGLTKDRVRKIARRYKLKNAHKKESQDICFVPKTGYQKFIEGRLGKKVFIPGPIKDAQGKTLAEHRGVAFYTIGQREGLGIAIGKPMYVYKIDGKINTIYVGGKEHLLSKEIIVRDLNFVSIKFPKKEIEVRVKIRYNHSETKAILIPEGLKQVRIKFLKPQKSATPGQSAVFYRNNILLGGGIIQRSS